MAGTDSLGRFTILGMSELMSMSRPVSYKKGGKKCRFLLLLFVIKPSRQEKGDIP
jgi:hypothetical protein